jgi:hypothetical protein
MTNNHKRLTFRSPFPKGISVRAEALHSFGRSPGPKTETGKTASSQNSRKHGLTFGSFRVLNTESQMQYQDFL